MTKKKRFHIIISVIFASMGIGVLGVLVYRLLRHFGLHLKPSILEDTDFKITHQGLSESEVEARRTDEAVQAWIFAKNRSRKNLWHKNLFSIFNLTFLVLAISQFLLKDPLGASLTMVALALSILFNIFRESVAAKKVSELAIQTRPMAAVIRDGQLKSIDQDEIVVDDLLIAGQGDEILADGILLESANLMIDETSLGEQGELVTKNAGDILFAGTYCQTGWVQYRVTRINIDSVVNEDPKYHAAPIRQKTPLQKIVDRVMYVLLVFVGIFYVSLIFELIRIQILPPELMDIYRQTLSIIFSIFPSGLMFTIVLNYAVGSADIARSDVLVRNSLTIESLAQVSTVGFIRHGEARGFEIELDMLSAADGSLKLSENQVMQALGNYVHSTLAKSYPLTIIKENLEGERRAIKQESRYLSIYGWEAATFSSADMPGSFVVGYPEMLAPYLIKQEVIEQETEENLPARKNRAGLAGRLRRWFGKGKGKTKNAAEIATNEAETQEVDTNPSQTEAAVQEKTGRLRIFNNFRDRLVVVFSRRKEDEEQPVEKGQEEIKRLMFAYSPDTQPVYDDDYRPQ
ncbi:MAG: hypothetical protein U9R53_09445, partial [Chloroflexota bacterium]|nr:hypothetical protein [Chloroflexota bacterium]